MTSRPAGTYVYCVLAGRKPPKLSSALVGPPGTGRPRVVEIRPQRYLVVSDAPLERFSEEQVARLLSDLRWVSRAAVAHEAVITSLLARSEAVVPMKLFTIFASDDRAVGQATADWKRIERALRRVSQQVEWGVRLSVDERRLAKESDAGPASTGIGYLRAKRRIRTSDAVRKKGHQRRATTTLRSLSRYARETRRRETAAGSDGTVRLLLDAAFLVPRGRTATFRAAVQRQARALARSGYRLRLTGPWPPYSFVEDRP